MTSGIYKIQSKIIPSRYYIGSATNIERRWKVHATQLRKGIHHSVKMQRHFNKYGEDDLMYILLCKCDRDRLTLLKNEQIFIDKYNPFFNTCKIAGSSVGIKQSDEFKRKVSERTKGNKYNLGKRASAETRLKRSIALKGHKVSEETRRKLSESFKGKIRYACSEETRAKMRITNKPPLRKGIKLTEEQKIKLRGRKFSEEQLAKLRGRIPWNKGKHNVYSKETLERMSRVRIERNMKPPSRKGMISPMKGKKYSVIALEKMRLAKLKRIA